MEGEGVGGSITTYAFFQHMLLHLLLLQLGLFPKAQQLVQLWFVPLVGCSSCLACCIQVWDLSLKMLGPKHAPCLGAKAKETEGLVELCGVVGAAPIQISGSRRGGQVTHRFVAGCWASGCPVSKVHEFHHRLAKHCLEAKHVGFTAASYIAVFAGGHEFASEASFACARSATDESPR